MNIVLFDGVCNFCNASVLRLIRLDKANQLRFASLQSEYALKILKSLQLNPADLNSIVFIKHSKEVYTKSTALLEIVKTLKGFPRLLLILRIIPRPVRDFLYDQFAKNRYKIFGKREVCMVPRAELKERFLE
jgi:predicted DCC family thiol-disulfide oxidoreductase YuxK